MTEPVADHDIWATIRAEAERDNILVQNKPVRPASMRAWLTQFSALQREAAE